MYKVLLVDDDMAERFLHKRTKAWADCGFTIAAEASDGNDALRAMEKSSFDLVVTDIRMPFMDGVELLKKIREKYPRLPVIFISSFSEFQYAQQGIVYGVFDYLTKPINEAKLADVLTRVKQRIEEQQEIKVDPVVSELLADLGLNEKDDEFIRQIAEYCTEHYKDDMSCDDCACVYGYHVKYFGKLFIQHFNMPFREFCTRVKIAYAIELLRSGHYRASEISDTLGYSSYKYFNQKFKEITGVTPSDYNLPPKKGSERDDIIRGNTHCG